MRFASLGVYHGKIERLLVMSTVCQLPFTNVAPVAARQEELGVLRTMKNFTLERSGTYMRGITDELG